MNWRAAALCGQRCDAFVMFKENPGFGINPDSVARLKASARRRKCSSFLICRIQSSFSFFLTSGNGRNAAGMFLTLRTFT